MSRLSLSVLTLVLGAGVLSGCVTMGMRSAVDLKVSVAEGTPREALVYIDDKYIGSLAAVAKRGVRVVEGKHRLTIEKVGYFPYDEIIVSRAHPIELRVELLKLPQ